MATVILTGGGTAGHCTPNIALLPYLKKRFDKIYYFGSSNGIEKPIANKAGIEYFALPTIGLKRKFTPNNLKIPFVLLSGINRAKSLIKKLKPDVIFSKGGYVALPTVIAGHKLNVPVIAHESDLTVGLANRISAKYCKALLTSFPETAKEIKNGRYVGSPVRRELFYANLQDGLKFFNLSGLKPVLLVFGGSLGAKSINSLVRKALDILLNKYDIIHIVGKNNIDNSINKKGYYQFEYVDKMAYAYAVSSVCLTRAGANTIFELLALNKPAVLIPLSKNASRGDQVENAEYFFKKGLLYRLIGNDITPEQLSLMIDGAYHNRDNLAENIKAGNFSDKGREIVDIIAQHIKVNDN